jgi:ribosomal protein L2
MKKSKKRLLVSWVMTLIMVLNIMPFNTVYAEGTGTDKTSVLTNIVGTVTQGGVIIPEGGTLNNTDNISVKISFKVPVEGDDPTPPTTVQKGDTASFEVSDAFTVVEGTNLPLKAKDSTVVGHANFITDPATKKVTANVIFDGEDDVFNGTANSVECNFNAILKYDGSGSAGDAGDHVVTILEKTYTVKVPPAEILYTVTKSGTPDFANKSIEWTVDISVTQAGKSIDLAGYQFFDDLRAVGIYVPNSFKVDDVSATPTVNDNTIRYAFQEGSKAPKKVTFKTEISDRGYYATSEQKVINKVQLQNSEYSVVKEGQFEVKFTPKWIEKTGESSDKNINGVYDPKNRTITWTITANHMGATLNNAVITDMLQDGLTLKSASWQAWDGTSWGTHNSIPPNASGEYALGNINSKILLTIVTNVPDEDQTTGIKSYRNSANIRWDGLSGPGPSTGNISVGVGYNAITKTGVADTSTRKIHWTITVDAKGQPIPDLKVYDLLVYGNNTSGFDLSKAAGIPSGINVKDLVPQYNQKYDDNFAGSGLNVMVHPITQDGKQVADLLEITGFSTASPNTFTFDSLIVNPDIFAGNKTSSVWNTATLFSANAKLNQASGRVDYKSKMLSKEMLKREAMPDPAAGVNSSITNNVKEGFDYQNKSVIFRLSINADGIDLNNMTNADGQTLATATVTDTLPDGWEFLEIGSGSKYLIFEGVGKSDGTVQAKDTTPDAVTGLNASFSGGTATFTFNPLDKPYVILVKARPTSETVAKYFSANKTTTERNNLSLKATNWTTGVTSFQDVSINSRLLEKTLTTPKAGELRWTVDYKPYDLSQPGKKLEDTLPIGIDLRTDSSGVLILSDGNITANEMTLNADGSYTLGAEVTLKLGENLFYDNKTRVLSFILPDDAKAYRFSYLTDITGEPGTVSNQVVLLGVSSEQEITATPYSIQAADGAASLLKNGWISITKIDGEGAPLAGAEFTIFASDGITVIRKGITSNDGILKLKVIPDGQYVLRETAAPTGYTLESVSHSLSVKTEGGKVTTSIDGKAGTNANAITVQNFPSNTTGNLTISKTVAGNASDTTKKFDFTVTFSGASGTYTYTGNGIPNGTIKSGDTVSLSHGQSITIMRLPKGTTYTVTEADYSGAGYSKVSTGEAGTIVADAMQTAAFINTRNVTPTDPGTGNSTGNLTVSKTVVGNAADTTKKFNFTVTFNGAPGAYTYTGNGVPNGTIKSGDTVSLAHGQSITITGLPRDTKYMVTEAEYSGDGYSKASAGEIGVISNNATQTAAFINTKNVTPPGPGTPIGNLTVSKTVAGNAADTTKKFNFTVTFSGATGTYTYAGNGVQDGKIKSGDTISLAHGQSITITGLPRDTKYTVTEADYSGDGYSKSSTGEIGTIIASTTQTASFTNVRNVPSYVPVGNLTIKKTVAGDLGDQEHAFTFLVDLSASGSYQYSGSKTGTIKGGQMITLKHGEYIVIEGLPVGTTYQVTEKEANKNGYSTSSTGASGKITESGQTSAFINTKSSVPKTGDDNLSTIWKIGLSISALMLLVLIRLDFIFRNKRGMKSR